MMPAGMSMPPMWNLKIINHYLLTPPLYSTTIV